MVLKTLLGLRLEGSSFKQNRPLLLLAYLCLEGPQERRHLAELFWPQSNNAIGNLNTVISRLNKVDDALIKIQDHNLFTELSSDARRLITAFEQEDYQKVIETYQGRFLEGFYLKDIGEELEEWLYETREALATKVRFAKLSQAEKKAKKGLFQEAAKEAEKAYYQASAKEPTEKDLAQIYKLLVTADHPLATDVKQEALSYGLELFMTKEEAQQLYVEAESPRGDEPTLEARAKVNPNNLAKQATPFIGRQKELELLGAHLGNPAFQLLSLIGPGGMGKTRLALALAEQHVDDSQFKDGIYLVELASLLDPANLLSAVAEALGYQFQADGRESEQQILDYLRNRQILLVLDNFEHLLDAAGLITRILQTAPTVQVLVTSRQRLGQPGETLFQLSGLDSSENVTLEAALDQPAVQLFVSSASRAQPGFELTAANVEAVLQICRQVQGMPLGIMLAASWLVMLTPEEIAGEIQQGLDFLEDEIGDMPERQHSIRVVFNYAWENLTKDEQQVFMTLSVFRGGFSREAAQAVSAASLPTLLSLTNKALIFRNAESGRFEIHELLRQYSFERLAEQPDALNETFDKHARYFAAFADQHLSTVWKGGEQQVLADIDNIRLGWQRAIRQGFFDDIARYAFFMFTLYEMLGWWQEAVATFKWTSSELASDVTDQTHNCVLGHNMAIQCFFYRRLGFNDRAQEVGRAAFKVLSECPPGISSTLGLSQCHRHGSAPGFDVVDDLQDLKTALMRASAEFNDSILASTVDLTLGNIATDQGLFDEAQAYFEKGIAWCRKNQIPRGIGWGLYGLTNIAIDRGQFEQAKSHMHEVLNLQVESDARLILSINVLAFIEYQLHNYEAAAEICFKVLHTVPQFGALPRIDTMLILADIMLMNQASESVVFMLSYADHLSLIPADQMKRVSIMTQQLQSELGDAIYKDAWARGASLDFEAILQGLDEDFGKT